MTPEKDDALQAYMQRILALKGQRDPDLTPEELGAIALEVGLTEADVAAGLRAGEDHLARGTGYLRHRRWNDAVYELSQALALLPNRLEALNALAEAHAGRFAAKGEAADREAAVRLARRCLAIDPQHEPAFKVLNALDRAGAEVRRRSAPWIAAMLAALVLVGGAGLLGLRSAPPAAQPAGVVEAQPVEEAEEEAPAPPGAVEIPVTLVGERAKDMTLEARYTQVDHYTDVSYYKLGAVLSNDGQREITKLHAQIELLDAAGKTLATDSFELLASQHAPMRPGDRHWFNQLLKASPALSRVRLTVLTRSDSPAARRYATSKALAPEWGMEKPPDTSLVLRERAAVVSRNSMLKDMVFLKPLFEIENTGETPVRQLKLQILLYDRQGQLLEADERLAVYGDGQELRPGETRVVNWIRQVAPEYHHYALKVLEVQ